MARPDLEVDVGGGLRLANPVLTASGTFGYGLEHDGIGDVAELGGICSKGLSLAPREGNPPERIAETAAGMLNAIGLANVGVDAFVREKVPALRERRATVIANVFATSVEDFRELARRLDGVEGVHALELNVSCPNVAHGGLEFGVDPKACGAVTRAVRDTTRLPIWVKLSPEASDSVAVARACLDNGADAVSAINTIRGMSVDARTGRIRLANRTGGLSGPAIKPIALRIVWEVHRKLPELPVIGIGGISTVEDAIEMLRVGARAVQVGTASFVDPRAAWNVLDGLRAFCVAQRTTARELVGTAW